MQSHTSVNYIRIASGLCFLALAPGLFAQPRDPGVRPGSDAGGALPGLPSPSITNAFVIAQGVFNKIQSVDGTVVGENDNGLGPSFNLNSCQGCHSFPSTGGSAPLINPEIRVATLHGAKNKIPSFISLNGPIREARFKRNPDGSPDGGVHDLFTITGRSDAPKGFFLPQTDFAPQVAKNNVSFRIPTPVFGAGLIEAIPDRTILINQAADAAAKANFGISGRINTNGNDGTITRFGWKAQNKSLLLFAGEAYNVEMGITNDIFPNAREAGDQLTPVQSHPDSTVDFATGGMGDIEQFMVFMRLLAPPTQKNPPGVSAASVEAGHDHFATVGCALCHTESMKTGTSPLDPLSEKVAFLFSDLLVHNMGPGLADEISQGNAKGDEFRSAPLWGLGQRIFFLHDGRTRDLPTAIRAHASNGNGTFASSEANKSVQAFNNMNNDDQQDLLNFLRSL